MNNVDSTKLMLPFLKEITYENGLSAKNTMVYGRFNDDFQQSCLLFQKAKARAMKPKDISNLRRSGFNVCYVYDQLDLENREFTTAGFTAINDDLEKIITAGYTHILLANAYLVELICNEYSKQLKIVISAQLEFNSAQTHVFLDVLNDTSAISHVVVSQNHLTPQSFKRLKKSFGDVQLVVEPDRWASDIQMVHEHYYNMVYGNYNTAALNELKKFVNQKKINTHVKQPPKLVLEWPDLMYKMSEVNCTYQTLQT